MIKLTTKFLGKSFQYTNSFEPNLTSQLIADVAIEIDLFNKNILDLGCGCGVLGLSLLKKKPKLVVLSDVSIGALEDCRQNTAQMGSEFERVNVDVIESDGFSKVKKEIFFDLIINDVSGISEDVAQLSPWFENAPCESGSDGLRFFKRIITEAPDYLSPDGILLTPLLSLSNVNAAQEFLSDTLTSFTSVKRKNWFLPETMVIRHRKKLNELSKSGAIRLDYKFGNFVAWTEVLMIRRNEFR
jgi:methylase of polypeptide subunit release factors